MDPTLASLMRSGPSERLRGWRAAPEADRFAWFLMLLDRCAAQAGTLAETRAALHRGENLTAEDIEALRTKRGGL